MIEHHIQKTIFRKLVEQKSAKFSELKPNDVDGNIFTYHLKQLVSQGLVDKSDEGQYSLSAKGKIVGTTSHMTTHEKLMQARAIFLIACRNQKGEWLLRKRLVQPRHGGIGFVHGEPAAGESLIETAQKRLLDKTGLTAKCSVVGSGYITINSGDELESFSQFTLLAANDPRGDLIASDKTGENFWQQDPDFSSTDMIPSMKDLVEKLESDGPNFFCELKYDI